MSPLVAEQEARRYAARPPRTMPRCWPCWTANWSAAAPTSKPARSSSAEVAFTVADDMQNRGIGMLLLEHLVSLGRGRGFRAFTAETLDENARMLRVFADAGLQAQRSLVDGVYDFRFPLPADEADATLGTYRDTVAVREQSADVASIRHALVPASIAVIGASRAHRIGRPGHPAQHHHRRLWRPGLPGQPGRGGAGRHPLPAVGGRAARGRRPGGPCRPGGGRARCRRRMRSAGGEGPGRGRGGTQRPGPRGAAGHLPPPRHADGRAGLRRGQSQHRPGCHVRGPPSRGWNGWPGPAVRPAAPASCW